MKYAIIKNNEVVQIEDKPRNGLILVDDNVVCGMIKLGDTFTIKELPDSEKLEIENKARVAELLEYLIDTDYKALKAFEGQPSEDWEEVKIKRQEARIEINNLGEE